MRCWLIVILWIGWCHGLTEQVQLTSIALLWQTTQNMLNPLLCILNFGFKLTAILMQRFNGVGDQLNFLG
jgi:hypothetical protein